MYVLPLPEIERGLEPTDFTFSSEDKVQDFINNDLEKAKEGIKKGLFGWVEEIEVTFLKVY
jgi:hypothetical protein